MKKIALIVLIVLTLCVNGLWAFQSGDPKEEEQETVNLPPINFDLVTHELLQSGKWREAAKQLIMLYESRVPDPNMKYYIAYCYENLGVTAFIEKKYADAITQFDNAIEYVNEWPRLYENIGICHYSLSHYVEAEEAFAQALQLKPDRFIALRMQGEICYITNRTNEALEHWQAALEVKPENEYLKKKVDELKELNRMSDQMETELDMMFAVSFNGTKKPQLRELVVKMLSDISMQVGQDLQLYPKRQIPVILLTDREFFDITGSPRWSGGVYEGHIKIPVDKYNPQLFKIVLTHEYIHAVIHDRLSYRCPWWLNEGLAQYFSGDTEGNEKKLKIAAKYLGEGKVPDLEKLQGTMLKNGDTESVQLAYALALSAVKFFVDNYGINDIQYALDLMGEGKNFSTILNTITGYSYTEFLANWKESLTH